MGAVTKTQVMTDLSYLLGEASTPIQNSSEDVIRTEYIQRGLERIYRAYNFPMNLVQATIQLNGGIATLPANVSQDGLIDVREVIAGPFSDHVYLQVPYQDHDNYQSGDYAYWLLGYEGSYTIYSSETANSPVLTLLYRNTLPTINASISTPFPSSMTIALAALKYYRLAEDPYTDVTPYENLFRLELNEVIAAYNRNRAEKRGKTQSEQQGTYTGDITTVGAYVGNAGNN